MTRRYDLVICGAGITGIAAAYYLSKAGRKNILLVDERPPLTLTSDRSTECYRNWWPDPAMLALMERSIDLMEQLAEESGNTFRLNRRGYLFVTGQEGKVSQIIERARRISELGAGPLRIHTTTHASYQKASPEDYQYQPDGADILLGPDLIRKYFPYLTSNAAAALHVRRAGWLSAQQMGMYMLEQSRMNGVSFEKSRVVSVQSRNGQVQSIQLDSDENVDTPLFVNASGPYLKTVGLLLDEELPVYTELHYKAAIQDSLGVVDRSAPLLIWEDAQVLPWNSEEKSNLEETAETRWLTDQLPSGVHTRPEGPGDSQTILMLWDCRTRRMDPVWPPPDDLYSEIALRGLAAMLPRMQEYFMKLPKPLADGGYYTRTRENRPLIGKTHIQGSYVIGAVSGYGIMSACAAGELLAAQILETKLPHYAAAFQLDRYEDPNYVAEIEGWNDTGQL